MSTIIENRIYIDTNIFVDYFKEDPLGNTHKQEVIDAFAVFLELDVELWTSMWTVTELVKVLTLNLSMDPNKVYEIEQHLVSESRFLGVKIHFTDVSPAKQ